MARARVKLNLKGIRQMKASLDEGFLMGLGDSVAARAQAAGQAVAHDGRYPVVVNIARRPVAGKVVIVSCPVPWAMAIEAKHGVMARALA